MKRIPVKNLFTVALRSAACGAVTGLIIFFFKLAASSAEHLSRNLYKFASGSVLYAVAVILFVLLMGVLTFFLHRRIPEVKGGGIPRSEGILRGSLDYSPIKTLVGTVVGSLISYISGMPLGSEGPAVLIGTSAGGVFYGGNRKSHADSRFVMTGGAGAGFAVATCAPLSGIIFCLEEVHKRITPILVLSVSLSVLSATAVNKLLCALFGLRASLFHLGTLLPLSFEVLPYLVLFGVIISVGVAVFDSSIEHFQLFCSKISSRFPKGTLIIPVFGAVAILGIVFPDGIYSGHGIIEELLHENTAIPMLILILFVRLIMMLLMTGTGATGGIFIPTLAIGVVSAAIAGRILVLIGFPSYLYPTVVFIGMCAFIGGTLRAPLTAAVLFSELTGHFSDFFYVLVVIFTVTLITDALNLVPFYDRVLEQLEEKQNEGKERKLGYFELTLSESSFAVGKTIRDIMWPYGSVVVSVKHPGDPDNNTYADGERILSPGDTIKLRALYYNDTDIKIRLQGIGGNNAPDGQGGC